MITEVEPEPLTDAEYAELGRKLANALADLRDMKRSAADSIKAMKEGIEDQEKEVARLANMIRSGQRELFQQPPNGNLPESGKSAASGSAQ